MRGLCVSRPGGTHGAEACPETAPGQIKEEKLSFEEFPKIARLSRACVITEKIDGTNAQVHIENRALFAEGFPPEVIAANDTHIMLAGSRNRYITPGADNFAFAAWVKANAETLWGLGEGRHFGEWWGAGIQRRYGLAEKRFSLFNVARWIRSEEERTPQPELHENRQRVLPACCSVVPVLYSGPFGTDTVDEAVRALREGGSVAAPGFTNPEGVVVYHAASRTMFKKTIEKDEEPKGKTA